VVDLLIVEEAVEAVNVVEEDTATIVADHLVVTAAATEEEEEEEEAMIVVDRVEVFPTIAGVAMEVEEEEAISRRMDLHPGQVVVAGAILTLEVVRMVVGTPTVVIRPESMNVVSMVT
jgi:hypothetical protein